MNNWTTATGIALCWLAADWLAPAHAQQTLTYADLVRRLTDLEALAMLPAPGERCAQASSYDRSSHYDEPTGRYVNWGANSDGNGVLRKEGKLTVMAEMEGPGVIWRIWSARADRGHVRIYLDGAEQPAVDLPFEDYFDGRHEPFHYPALSYEAAKGKNLYFPIPYQKSCKVVADPGWGDYYHFNYTTLPKGTKLPTFSTRLSAGAGESLQQVNDYLLHRLGTDPAGSRPGQQVTATQVTAPPGTTVPIASLEGPRAITALRATLDFTNREDQVAALRKLALQITWDGAPDAAVWCPLGDFFGTAPGENLFQALPAGMTTNGYYALWYMPFARKACLELINEDERPREVKIEITHAPVSRPLEQLARFHAKWHRDVFPVSKDRRPDWTLLRTQGAGRFCGAMLHVWNPRGGWWGEGDEKFFVDGEKFPSTFGTGSEDYFGYAWGTFAYFARPFHAQTLVNRRNGVGHLSNVRWQVAENVPFDQSFEGCIEKFDYASPDLRYAATVWWYLSPNGTDPHGRWPVTERVGYDVVPRTVVAGQKIIGLYHGALDHQDMRQNKNGKWLNDDALLWRDTRPGDRLTIAVPVAVAGQYRVKAAFSKARDYAIVQLYLDDQKLGRPVDLYNPTLVPTEPPLDLGVHHLSAGEHRFQIEIVGANEKAGHDYWVGFDEVVLELAKPKDALPL
jgi:hypothetical protein